MSQIIIDLPEPLATRARDNGLLAAERLASLLEAELERMEGGQTQASSRQDPPRFRGPLIGGDPELSKAIAQDPEFNIENSKPWG